MTLHSGRQKSEAIEDPIEGEVIALPGERGRCAGRRYGERGGSGGAAGGSHDRSRRARGAGSAGTAR